MKGFNMTMRTWISVLAITASLGMARLSAHEEYRFIGTVVTMDESRQALTIKGKDYDQEFTVRIGSVTVLTPIEKDGKKVGVAELKPGTFVVVDTLGDETGPFDALRIKIVPPPASSK
jgi:hypothetical protein